MSTFPTTARRKEVILLLVTILPAVALAAVFALEHVREAAAESRMDAIVTRLKSEGLPTDNHSCNVAFDRRLSKENSAKWRDILLASREIFDRFEPMIVPVDHLETTLATGAPWEEEPIARRVTEAAQPILETLQELSESDDPVWQPLVIRGFETTLAELQASNTVGRLLMIEFRHAVHQGDQERALIALKSMVGLSDAFDWQVGLVSDLIALAPLNTHRRMIRESLEVGFWQDEDQLLRLRDQLSVRDDLDARWKWMIAFEQAMLLSELSSQDRNSEYALIYPFGVTPTTVASLVERMTKASAIEGVGTMAHAHAIEREIDDTRWSDDQTSTYTINGIPFAHSKHAGLLSQNFSQASYFYAQDQLDRRWTKVAVAIKLFHLQQGRWPQRLDELVQTGLVQADWMAVADTPFGYAVDSDSEQAILWLPFEVASESVNVSAIPPSETVTDPELVEICKGMETRIR